MRKVNDEVSVLPCAGNDEIQRIRVRLYIAEPGDDGETVYFIATYIPPTPEPYVPDWLLQTAERLAAVSGMAGKQLRIVTYYPERTYPADGGSVTLASCLTVLDSDTGKSVPIPCEETYRQMLETTLGEPLDSPEPAGEPAKLLILRLRASDQVYSFEDGDGVEYHWNASMGMRLIEANPRETVIFSLVECEATEERIKERYPEIDEHAAMQADLTMPLLFVPHRGKVQCVDGWHRMWKAATLGMPELPAYVLTEAEANMILIAQLEPGKGIMT